MDDQGPPEALFRFFEAMPRQGPGSQEETRWIYERARPHLPPRPRVADMGSGDGAATLFLAEQGAQVTAVDIWRPFLDRIEERAREKGLAERVSTREASMLTSGLEPSSLDLIWSEGSVYTVGFDAALERFQELLVSGGLVVASECTWLVEQPPHEASEFWSTGYPAMRSVSANLRAALENGWRFLGAHTLPNEVWEEGFYGPMEALMKEFEGDESMRPVLEENRSEIDVFRRYNHTFGYVFYLLAKP